MLNTITKNKCYECNRVFYCIFPTCDRQCKRIRERACLCPECFGKGGVFSVDKIRFYSFKKAFIEYMLNDLEER